MENFLESFHNVKFFQFHFKATTIMTKYVCLEKYKLLTCQCEKHVKEIYGDL